MSITEREKIEVRETTEIAPLAVPHDPILAHAVAVLRRKGWTQRRLRDSRTGQVCAIGAISSVRLRGNGPDLPGTRAPHNCPARMQAIERLARSLGWDRRRTKEGPMDFIVDWNDDPGRTADQVTEAVERAAWL